MTRNDVVCLPFEKLRLRSLPQAGIRSVEYHSDLDVLRFRLPGKYIRQRATSCSAFEHTGKNGKLPGSESGMG